MQALVFPGQGSQFKGMGDGLFQKFPEQVEIAGDILGFCVKSLCLEDKEKKLHLTQYTQPAIYVVSALHYLNLVDDGDMPALVAGHSLGEYSALFAASVFSFEEGLKAVKRRGELMSMVNGGSMAAILGLGRETVDDMLREHGNNAADVANYNTPTQTVISGQTKDVMALETPVTKANGRFIPLMVSSPFHSRYMQGASDTFSEFLSTLTIKPPALSVVSSVFARPYTDVNEIASTLSKQIRLPVRWVDVMHYFLAKDVQLVTEVGPGTVLTKMFADIKESAQPQEISAIKLRLAQSDTGNASVDGSAADVPEASVVEKSPPVPAEIKRNRLKLTPRQLLSSAPQQQPEVVRREPAPADASVSGVQARPPAPSRNIGVNPPPAASEKVPEAAIQSAVPARQPERPFALGNQHFCRDYGLKMPYVAGGMQQGIASRNMVARLASAGLLGFLGAHRMDLKTVEEDVRWLSDRVPADTCYGINIVHLHDELGLEQKLVDIALAYRVPVLELSNFYKVDKNLLRYRFKGSRWQGTDMLIPNRLLLKTSRLEIAEHFMSPAPKELINELLASGELTRQEADIASSAPVCSDVCAESNSGWKSDSISAGCLWTQAFELRDKLQQKFNYALEIRVGVAGGLGTPQALAAAFFAGADFVVTGSINQCTVEAGVSDMVKDMLQNAKIQDMDYAPFVDLFETGVKAQVLKRGVFFPSRARKLYEIYCQLTSLDCLSEELKTSLETRYFKRPLSEVWQALSQHYDAALVARANIQPKLKMSLIFKHYLHYGCDSAIAGSEADKTNFQVFCSPAMGAFNEHVKDTGLQNWRNRHVDEIGLKIMQNAEKILQQRVEKLLQQQVEKRRGSQRASSSVT